jgi:LSD1 subclass zinc finger protein
MARGGAMMSNSIRCASCAAFPHARLLLLRR